MKARNPRSIVMSPRLTANRITANVRPVLGRLFALLCVLIVCAACNQAPTAPTVTLTESAPSTQSAQSAEATESAGASDSTAAVESGDAQQLESTASAQTAASDAPWGHCDADRFFLDGLSAAQALTTLGADPASITDIEDSTFTGCTIWGDFDGPDEFVQVYDPGQLNGISFDVQAGVFFDGTNLTEIDGYRAVSTGQFITVDLGDHALVVQTTLGDDATMALTRQIIGVHPGAGASTVDRGAPPIVDFDADLDGAFGIDPDPVTDDGSDDAIPLNPATGLPEWIEGDYPSWVTCDDQSVLGTDAVTVAANMGQPAIVGAATDSYTTLNCALLVPTDEYGPGVDFIPGLEVVAEVEEIGGQISRAGIDDLLASDPRVESVAVTGGSVWLVMEGNQAVVITGAGDTRVKFLATSLTGEHSADEIRQAILSTVDALAAAGMPI